MNIDTATPGTMAVDWEARVDMDRLLEVSRRLELDHGATLNSAFYRYARSGKSPQVRV